MVKSATRITAKLHLASSKSSCRAFELTQARVNVGRDETNLIRLDNPSVSLHHAILVHVGAHYRVRDLISTNGTYLNGERTLGAELHDGDRIRFGEIELRYEEMPGGGLEPERDDIETVLPLGRGRARGTSTRWFRRVRWLALLLIVMAGGFAWKFDAWPFGVHDPLSRFRRSVEARLVDDPLYAAVNTAEDKKDYATLLENAKLLVEHHPRSALANYILGTAYGKLNYFSDAVAAFREAIKLQPGYTDAWNNLGWAYAQAGRFADAVGAYQQLTKLAPGDANAWTELGRAYAGGGHQPEALGAYRMAVQLKPESADNYLSVGAACANLGRIADAISAFREALKRDPNLPEAWFNLGVISRQQGENKEAILFFRQAINLKSNYAEAWAGLVKTYLDLRQIDKAGDAAREMKRLDPAKAEQLADELSREAPPLTIQGAD
jgi:tetratricopeptide (TPR) repeat protein